MRALSLLFVALLLAGCGGTETPQAKAPAPDTTKPTPVEISFARDIQSLAGASCMPCHSGAKDAATRSNWTTYEGVMTEVVAGQPDSSKFYRLIRDGKMPPAGKLDSSRITLVYEWISEGAKDN